MAESRPVALVTGARRGIGAAIALALARTGFDVVITDRVEDDEAHATLAALRASGANECLVNNAGVSSPTRGDLLDMSPDAFDQVLEVNLRGTFFFTQQVARH